MITDLTVPADENERLKWAEETLNTVSRYSSSNAWNKARYNYEQNFTRFLGEVDLDELKYMTHTYGDDKAKPFTAATYPLLEPLIQRMIGEYTSQPVPFSILRINKNAYSSKMNLLGRLAAEKVLAPIWAEAEKTLGVKLPIERKMELIPEQFRSMPQKSIRDSLEINLKYGLNYLYYNYNFGDELSKCFYDLLINSDEYAKIDIVNNDPVINHVPIQNAVFQRGEGNYVFDKIHRRSPFMGKDVWLPLSEIINRYGYRLKTKQRKQLLDDQQSFANGNATVEEWNSKYGYCVRRFNGALYYRVIDIEVKAHSEKQFLTMPYEKDNDKVYSSHDITNIWELVKISRDIILRPMRRKNEIPLKGNYLDLQFSYFGMLSRHSFYDRAYPVQKLYSLCLMTLDFLLSQSGGKATRYATERKPDNMELEDIAYSGKVMGLIVEQVRAGDINGRSVAGGEVDFGPSASIQYIIALATMLIQTAERMTGQPDARSGRAASTSPVGTVQSNLVQSSYVTKPVFDVQSTFTETGLQRCADLIRYLWTPGDVKAYVTGDGAEHVFKVSEDFELGAAGIYVQSGLKAAQGKEVIIGMMEKTLATDATMALEMIKAYNSETAAEAEVIMENAINIMRKAQAQMDQAKIDVMKEGNMIAQRANDLKEEELFIKKTVPVRVAETQKASAENVALINKEKALNESEEARILQNDQMLFEKEQAEKDRQQEMMQPAAATAE